MNYKHKNKILPTARVYVSVGTATEFRNRLKMYAREIAKKTANSVDKPNVNGDN